MNKLEYFFLGMSIGTIVAIAVIWIVIEILL